MVFRAARVWDGVADAPFEDGFVAVEGETITAVGRWAEVGEAGGPVPGLPVTDCGNATLLPGLINSHVHLTLSGSTTVLEDYLAEQAAGPEALMARAAENLRAAVRGGVTGVRDCGTVNEVAFAVRDAVAAGRLIGPRVVTSGAPLTSPGGHCHFFSLQVASPDELRRAVSSQARAGADLIKVFVTGGNLTPNTDPFALQYSAETLTVAVNAAHGHGLPVAAHAHAPAGIRVAVEAPVDTIEHCLVETPAGVAYDEAVVDRIAAQGIAVSPTVGNPPAATADESEALIVADPAWQRLFERLSEFRRNFRRMFDAGVVLAEATLASPAVPSITIRSMSPQWPTGRQHLWGSLALMLCGPPHPSPPRCAASVPPAGSHPGTAPTYLPSAPTRWPASETCEMSASWSAAAGL